MELCLIGPVGMTILRSNHGTPTVFSLSLGGRVGRAGAMCWTGGHDFMCTPMCSLDDRCTSTVRQHGSRQGSEPYAQKRTSAATNRNNVACEWVCLPRSDWPCARVPPCASSQEAGGFVARSDEAVQLICFPLICRSSRLKTIGLPRLTFSLSPSFITQFRLPSPFHIQSLTQQSPWGKPAASRVSSRLMCLRSHL